MLDEPGLDTITWREGVITGPSPGSWLRAGESSGCGFVVVVGPTTFGGRDALSLDGVELVRGVVSLDGIKFEFVRGLGVGGVLGGTTPRSAALGSGIVLHVNGNPVGVGVFDNNLEEGVTDVEGSF